MLEISRDQSAQLLSDETGRPYAAGNVTVQFMHRTVLDYLPSDRVWQSLFPEQRLTFSINRALLVGLVAAMRSESEVGVWHDWVSAVKNVVLLNREAEKTTQTAYPDVLDTFDLLMSATWMEQRFQTKHNVPRFQSDDIKRHWTNFLLDLEDFGTPEHHHNTFFSFAVSCGFERYVEEKLKSLSDHATRKNGRPLLDYAVYPPELLADRWRHEPAPCQDAD